MNWLIPANTKFYDIDGALKEYGYVDWTQKSNYKVGDIVYIYKTFPTQKIQYKTIVRKKDLTFEESVNDESFWINKEAFEKGKQEKFVRLELMKEFTTDQLALEALMAHGLNSAPQSPIRLLEETMKYIKEIEEVPNKKNFRKILKDNYIDFAYNRYLDFKESSQYDEQYKMEILEELNIYFRENEISENTVLAHAKKIQSSNPSSGSFTHWSNTDSLVKFAEGSPKEAAEVWNTLYDDEEPLFNRITNFRKELKKLDEELAIGAPLFGYLLAAYDYSRYPLYKGDVYQKTYATYELEIKMGSIEKNYTNYYLICEIILEYIQSKNEEATMLDAQDFLYCTTRYDKLKVEVAVDYLFQLSQILQEFKEDNARMIESIMSLDKDVLLKLREVYRNREKVKKIRFLILDKMIEDNSFNLADLEQIKNEVQIEYDTNILHSWNNFTLLFYLFYYDKKDKVQNELGKIHRSIRQIDQLKEFDFVEGRTLNGFNWNQNFGRTDCWLAVYESKYKNHRKAIQFFFAIREDGLEYGLMYGSEHQNSGKKETDRISNATLFTYEQLEEKMNEVSDQINNNTNIEIKNQYYNEDVFSKNEWLELLTDPLIFNEDNLEMLLIMHEMGGGATASQLAESLGKHSSSFNSPVGALAKRVYENTGIDPFIGDDGRISYWRVFFNGSYADNNHFHWEMKDNLKEAVTEYLEISSKITKNKPYTQNDFLEEVFVTENQYETMIELIDYKKNIILQGPPGVGKTFVAKRLAYSLIEQKNDNQVQMVQFHQSYAYEDFIMGFRPDTEGKFALEYGVFHDFCSKAIDHPEKNYYFIIDEINRGNLSKIFGELFMLIENEKRDEFVTMGYSKEQFTVPSNVYLIGTMNTADRSLAPLEIALRRRFSFITLEPNFNQKWQQNLLTQGVSEEAIENILQLVENVNREISEDLQLGAGYEIGHSFFTNKPDKLSESRWIERVIQFEIKPLLEEYFFDRPEKVANILGDYNNGTNI